MARKRKKTKTPPELWARWRETHERMERVLDKIRAEEAAKAAKVVDR